MLNGALVIDMAKTSTVVFMKERTSLVVEDRNALIKKNRGRRNMAENQMCQRTANLPMANLLSNGLHEKGNVTLVKVDYI